MILLYNHRSGQIRNTEKPYYIEWYYDPYRVDYWRERLKSKSQEDRNYYWSYRESRWSYYRSYKTLEACLQAWNDMTNEQKKHKVCTCWYRIGKTDFSNWPAKDRYGQSLILTA